MTHHTVGLHYKDRFYCTVVLKRHIFVSWEPEGCYCSSKIFRWEPDGRYRHRLFTAIALFWFSREHRWAAITPFWFSTDVLSYHSRYISTTSITNISNWYNSWILRFELKTLHTWFLFLCLPIQGCVVNQLMLIRTIACLNMCKLTK